ncbi:MAG: hypothetical protein AAGK04_06220 [Planctomycetota bacterium]
MQSAIIVSAVAALAGQSLGGALLTFEGLPSAGEQVRGVPPPETVLTDDFQNLGVLFGGPTTLGVAVVDRVDSFAPSSGVNSVVGLDASGSIPFAASGSIEFRFVEPGTATPSIANGVSFTIGDSGNDLDQFVITAFGAGGQILEQIDEAAALRFAVDLSVDNISSVQIAFPFSDTGYSLDDLAFTIVPAPGTSVVMGLALLALRRRR